VAVLPLFLAHGYHVRHDGPRAVAGALAEIRAWRGGWTPDVTFCDPLGPDPLLSEAMDARLRAAGVWPTDPRLGLIVASAGSSDSSALAQVEAVARSWGGADNAYAAAAPTTAQAIARLRARGREDVAVASYFLAPGRLPDRVHADCVEAGVPFGGPLLTPDSEPPDELVRLVLARYASAAFLPSAGNLAA
jgi:sirohydrochlorin ferrochelatase